VESEIQSLAAGTETSSNLNYGITKPFGSWGFPCRSCWTVPGVKKWKAAFEKSLFENYSVKPHHYEELENGV